MSFVMRQDPMLSSDFAQSLAVAKLITSKHMCCNVSSIIKTINQSIILRLQTNYNNQRTAHGKRMFTHHPRFRSPSAPTTSYRDHAQPRITRTHETKQLTCHPFHWALYLTYLRQHVTHDLPMLTGESLRRLTLAVCDVGLPSAEYSTHARSRPVRPTCFFDCTCWWVPWASRMCVNFKSNQGNRPRLSSFGSMSDLSSKL